jgi:cation:H+ antiporter
MSEWMVAVTIVAAGTSAPEVATSLIAALKGRHGMSIGNLVGSDLFNLLGVLGLAGTIQAMSVTSESTQSVYLLAGMCFMTVLFMRTNWRISRPEGIVLVLVALLRWGQNFAWG